MLRPLTVLVAVLAAAWAAASDVAVHPFQSQDPVLGVAVAERVAGALEGVDVLGPELTPTLVAPIVVPGGFLNPLALLPAGVHDRTGIALLRDALGVDVAVAGRLRVLDDGLVLELLADVGGRLRSVELRAPSDDPGALAAPAAALIAGWSGGSLGRVRPLDLSGVDGDAARARALLGAGFAFEALETLQAATGLDEVDAALRDGLAAAVAGGGDAPPALAAAVALFGGEPAATAAALARWADAGAPGVVHVWAGALARSVEDDAAARAAFDAAAGYPYGRAARAADRAARGDAAGAREDLALLGDAGGAAALVAASFVAQSLEDPELEDQVLQTLARVAPFFPYPFERRSFLAFDRDDPLAAAQALTVAVDLEPDSDLYWTNLGWARYLLGDLAGSEAASRRALELDAAQFVARYNLGLVEVVTRRLDDALATYAQALRVDPDVDDEAIQDLVRAESAYPDALGVPFALGVLLEQEGDRAGAADAFARYATRAAAAPRAVDAGRLAEAQARADGLRAPPPPIEVLGGVRVALGARGAALDGAQPGDPLTLLFEVSTPGDALPRRLDLEATLRAVEGGAPLATATAQVDVPTGAIGLVVDALRLELPVDLPAGRYAVEVVARGGDVAARAARDLEVAGTPDVLRQLVGRGLTPTALETGRALVTERDLQVARETVLGRFVAELSAAAASADQVLPALTTGRFAGSSGGEAFLATTTGDVADFLAYLVATGARDTTFTFVDGYAQWLVDGTPTTP